MTLVGTYRNRKTLQRRGAGGRFSQWDLDRDFGVGVCPWCRSGITAPPGADDGVFVDPAAFKARVCACGYDSRRGVVTADDFTRLVRRAQAAQAELDQADPDGDDDTYEILQRQASRAQADANALIWITYWWEREHGGAR